MRIPRGRGRPVSWPAAATLCLALAGCGSSGRGRQRSVRHPRPHAAATAAGDSASPGSSAIGELLRPAGPSAGPGSRVSGGRLGRDPKGSPTRRKPELPGAGDDHHAAAATPSKAGEAVRRRGRARDAEVSRALHKIRRLNREGCPRREVLKPFRAASRSGAMARCRYPRRCPKSSRRWSRERTRSPTSRTCSEAARLVRGQRI